MVTELCGARPLLHLGAAGAWCPAGGGAELPASAPVFLSATGTPLQAVLL